MAAESATVLAHRGADEATLVVIADGKRHEFRLGELRVLRLVETGVESLRRMKDPAAE